MSVAPHDAHIVRSVRVIFPHTQPCHAGASGRVASEHKRAHVVVAGISGYCVLQYPARVGFHPALNLRSHDRPVAAAMAAHGAGSERNNDCGIAPVAH